MTEKQTDYSTQDDITTIETTYTVKVTLDRWATSAADPVAQVQDKLASAEARALVARTLKNFLGDRLGIQSLEVSNV